MQHLIIENFGPVQKIELDVNDLLLFVGPQASGKSTISKAIYFFKSLRDDLAGHIRRAYDGRDFTPSVSHFAKHAKNKFLSIYGPVRHFTEMRLEYDYGDGLKVRVYPENGYLTVYFDGPFNKKFKDLMNEARELRKETDKKNTGFRSSREISEMKSREAAFFDKAIATINALFHDDRDLIFVPAGRSLLPTLARQWHNLDLEDYLDGSETDIESFTGLDYLTQVFIERIKDIRPIFSQHTTELLRASQNGNSHKAKEIIDHILKGQYQYEEGLEKIYFDTTNEYTLINYASSGQQETIWILLLIFLLILNKRKVFLVVEEPEAHLFPTAQQEIVNLLALLANSEQNQIVLTTHSPYILSSFNNLLYAYILGQQHQKEVSAIVSPNFWVSPHKIGAFMVKNGSGKTILDAESHLILSAAIDDASQNILQVFNELFELDNE